MKKATRVFILPPAPAPWPLPLPLALAPAPVRPWPLAPAPCPWPLPPPPPRPPFLSVRLWIESMYRLRQRTGRVYRTLSHGHRPRGRANAQPKTVELEAGEGGGKREGGKARKKRGFGQDAGATTGNGAECSGTRTRCDGRAHRQQRRRRELETRETLPFISAPRFPADAHALGSSWRRRPRC